MEAEIRMTKSDNNGQSALALAAQTKYVANPKKKRILDDAIRIVNANRRCWTCNNLGHVSNFFFEGKGYR
jgi:hypothetical protein